MLTEVLFVVAALQQTVQAVGCVQTLYQEYGVRSGISVPGIPSRITVPVIPSDITVPVIQSGITVPVIQSGITVPVIPMSLVPTPRIYTGTELLIS